MAKLDLSTVRYWLTQRFGKPDKENASASGVSLVWRDGAQRLQVGAGNQVDVMRRGVGYRSQLALALWSEDYEDHLEQVNERCDKIRKLPRSEMSIDQSMFFVSSCSLAAGHRIEPGL